MESRPVATQFGGESAWQREVTSAANISPGRCDGRLSAGSPQIIVGQQSGGHPLPDGLDLKGGGSETGRVIGHPAFAGIKLREFLKQGKVVFGLCHNNESGWG